MYEKGDWFAKITESNSAKLAQLSIENKIIREQIKVLNNQGIRTG